MQFTDFAHMAFNSITNEIAKYRYRSNGDWSVPLVVRARWEATRMARCTLAVDRSALCDAGLEDRHPIEPLRGEGLLLAAIRDPDPVLFFEHKRLYRMFKEPVPKGEYLIPCRRPGLSARGQTSRSSVMA